MTYDYDRIKERARIVNRAKVILKNKHILEYTEILNKLIEEKNNDKN